MKEAREIVANTVGREKNWVSGMLKGQMDKLSEVQIALAALKRGMELGRAQAVRAEADHLAAKMQDRNLYNWRDQYPVNPGR